MKSDKKPYDTAFKRLAEQDPEALLRLVGALPLGATVRILPREISAPALAADQPYEIIGENLHYIAHLEAQIRWKADVPHRIVEYDALFWINYHLPIRSFVLVLIPDGLPPDAPTQGVVQADGLTLIAHFTIVRLWELSAANALAQGRESLLPFIPLMNGGANWSAAPAPWGAWPMKRSSAKWRCTSFRWEACVTIGKTCSIYLGE